MGDNLKIKGRAFSSNKNGFNGQQSNSGTDRGGYKDSLVNVRISDVDEDYKNVLKQNPPILLELSDEDENKHYKRNQRNSI